MPQNVTVDSNAIASAIVSGLQKSGVFTPQKPQVQEPVASEFESTLKSLADNPETDQATLSGLQSLFKSFQKDIEDRLGRKHAEDLRHSLEVERDKQARNLIMLSLDEYIGDDPKLRKKEEWLYHEVVKEFNDNPDYAAARAKYANGAIDLPVIKKISLKVINEETGKGNQPNARGVKGVTQQESAAAQAGSMPESGDEINPKNLKGAELEYYNARMAIAQKMGHLKDSKEAKELAARAVRTMRASKARTK